MRIGPSVFLLLLRRGSRLYMIQVSRGIDQLGDDSVHGLGYTHYRSHHHQPRPGWGFGQVDSRSRNDDTEDDCKTCPPVLGDPLLEDLDDDGRQ